MYNTGRQHAATQQDLSYVSVGLGACIDRGFHRIRVTVTALMLAGYLATITATVIAVLLR